MAVEITLAQFNKIAIGDYNAGFVDFKTDDQGNVLNELRKVNNHVHMRGKNKEEISPERVLQVKEAFVDAMRRGNVSEESIKAIRQELGIPTELDVNATPEARAKMLTARYTPLTRTQTRYLLDTYAEGGRGFGPNAGAGITAKDLAKAEYTRKLSGSDKTTRMNVNMENIVKALGNVDYATTDVLSILSLKRPLTDLKAAMARRHPGDAGAAQREVQERNLSNSYTALFSVALKLLGAGSNESPEFEIMGETVKLVKGGDGKLTAIVGTGGLAAEVKLGYTAQDLVDRMVGRAAMDKSALGASCVKEMLNTAFTTDIKNGLRASDRTSLTRGFAAVIIEMQGAEGDIADGEQRIFNLNNGNYNTGLLVQIAQRTLDGGFKGDNAMNTKAKLDQFYARMRQDTAGLPQDIKDLLADVADREIEWMGDNGQFIVHSPIVGNIDQHVNAIRQNGPAPELPKNVTMADVKDFVADFVFSGDTMVADAMINVPGEQMRKALSDPKKIAAFAEILKNPNVLDTAAAPQIAGVLKEGFATLKEKLDAPFKAAHAGQTIDQAAQSPDFAEKFAAFLRNDQQLSGDVIAQFDDVLDDMATKACVKIQDFVNEVFDVKVQGGVNVVKDPYSKMSKEDIVEKLNEKTLNDILDAKENSEVPGQAGFFKQVVSTYFTSMRLSDKRSCLASALRYANVFDFGDKKDDALKSAKTAAVNKFTGAILKGAGPLLHKMMQGLPKEIMGDYADALADMKENLAPIPRKIVQGYLNKIMKSNEAIKSIKLEKSLGAASVGEAFLCTFTVDDGKGGTEDRKCVVKIMRHDAESRVKEEAEIFNAAAEKVPGMAKTWAGQLKQYMTEFDFRTEAQNVEIGVGLYNITNDHDLCEIAPDVRSMKMSNLFQPEKNVMVAEAVNGKTVDTYFKEKVAMIRNAADAVFEQDPETKRIKWTDGPINPETGKPTKVPVMKKNLPAMAVSNLKLFLSNNYTNLESTSKRLLQATQVWFYNAILGDGKFHGDTHSGNLMVGAGEITFIDFGNMYKLDKNRPDGVNEQQALLRTILGAAFRNKSFVLDGFRQLMSQEGKERLAKPEVKAKAEAILDSVLSSTRGNFAFNIVYRLQAAVLELQKLGLELPPQINCFIQSMVRLSNTVAEINTILNQTKALVAAATGLDIKPEAPRDELDLIGKAFDLFASPEGQQKVRYKTVDSGHGVVMNVEVPEDENEEGVKYLSGTKWKVYLRSEELGGSHKVRSDVFKAGGTYSVKVAGRLSGAQDPVAEAEKLTARLVRDLDAEHCMLNLPLSEKVNAVLDKFKTDFAAAGDNQELRSAAITAFANAYARETGNSLNNMMLSFETTSSFVPSKIPTPMSFASAITGILLDNFEDVQKTLGSGGMALGMNASDIARNELHAKVGIFDVDGIVNAIKNDAKNQGGEKDYKVDIGV